MRKKILLSLFIFTLETHLSAAVWPGDTWQTASPESQGMSSAKLAQAPSKAEIEMGDVIVIRNGYANENEGWQIHLNKTGVWKGLPKDCYAAMGACDRSSILVCPSLNLVIARKGPTSSPYSDRCVDSPQRWAKSIFDAIDDKVSLSTLVASWRLDGNTRESVAGLDGRPRSLLFRSKVLQDGLK